MEASNYHGDEEYCELSENIDEFPDSAKKIQKFEETLINPVGEQTRENSCLYSILYAIRYQKTKKEDNVSDEIIAYEIGKKLFDDLVELKDYLILDLNYANFEKTCYSTNDLVMKNDYFLGIFELKEKFRHMTHDNRKNKNIIRNVSSCINKSLTVSTFW